MAHILIVEDERRLAATLKRGLEGEGFTVDVALDGVDGKWMAEQATYDALVLDVMLPGVNGHEICAALRQSGDWTPILMLTARVGARDELRAFDTGADDYLAKPFAFAVLVARLRSLLRRGGSERPAALVAGDLTLDPASHRCLRGTVEIELTSREFSILEFLLRRRGDVVSKLDILENVWDFAFEGDPNIVEVYVGRLRRKVDAPFGRHAIVTIRGVGYRMAADGG